MRVIVMGPLKISSQVRVWLRLLVLRLSFYAVFHPTSTPTLGVWLPHLPFATFSFFLFPFSPPSSLLTLSAQDGSLHCPHWQADVQAPL